MSELALLNVGTGDTKISFDPEDPEGCEHAALLVRDMLRKGYAILVEVGTDDKGPIYRRAKDFDADTHEYIVAGLPPAEEVEAMTANQGGQEVEPKPRAKRGTYTRRGTGRATTRVSARTNKAVGVAPTAGG